MKKTEIDPSPVLVERLCNLYWPKGCSILWRELTVDRLLTYEPFREYIEEDLRFEKDDTSSHREVPVLASSSFEGTDDHWHIRRARFFYDEILAGRTLDPISLDNVCNGGRIYAQPVVIDGHHRLGGALLAGAKVILAHYGGRVDLLRYLTGNRRTCPRD